MEQKIKNIEPELKLSGSNKKKSAFFILYYFVKK